MCPKHFENKRIRKEIKNFHSLSIQKYMFTFCCELLSFLVYFPCYPHLVSLSDHHMSNKYNDSSHFLNFSCRQSNSPPPIRRQPTWSRSSLVCRKSSGIKWSDSWGVECPCVAKLKHD